MVKEPGHKGIRSIGTGGSDKLEIDGSYTLLVTANADLGKLMLGEKGEGLGAFRIGVEIGFDFMLGFILDVENKEIGGYLEVDFHGIDLDVTLGLPWGGLVTYSESGWRKRKWDLDPQVISWS